MGLENGCCDSCGELKSVLMPLAVLDELPSGISKLVIKYYCENCAEIMLSLEDNLDEKEPLSDDVY